MFQFQHIMRLKSRECIRMTVTVRLFVKIDCFMLYLMQCAFQTAAFFMDTRVLITIQKQSLIKTDIFVSCYASAHENDRITTPTTATISLTQLFRMKNCNKNHLKTYFIYSHCSAYYSAVVFFIWIFFSVDKAERNIIKTSFSFSFLNIYTKLFVLVEVVVVACFVKCRICL